MSVELVAAVMAAVAAAEAAKVAEGLVEADQVARLGVVEEHQE